VRPLFLERCRTVADFDPAGGIIRAEPSVLHISQVLAFRDGASSQTAVVDGFEEAILTASIDAGA
jgi:hypothetical protein